MAKKKKSTNSKLGRPKGSRDKSSIRYEYVRDFMMPALAEVYGIKDPIKAAAKWMNEDPKNKEWWIKKAMGVHIERGVAREISDRELEIETLRANALKDSQSETGGSNTTNIMMTPSFPMGTHTEQSPVIDVEVEEPKKLPESVKTQGPEEPDDPI